MSVQAPKGSMVQAFTKTAGLDFDTVTYSASETFNIGALGGVATFTSVNSAIALTSGGTINEGALFGFGFTAIITLTVASGSALVRFNMNPRLFNAADTVELVTFQHQTMRITAGSSGATVTFSFHKPAIVGPLTEAATILKYDLKLQTFGLTGSATVEITDGNGLDSVNQAAIYIPGGAA